MRRFSLALAMTLVAAIVPTAGLAQPVPPPSKPVTPPPPRPLGPELWRGARTGMAQEDIAKLFPAATASKGELLRGGSRSGLTLAVQLAGAPGTAQFYFDAYGLTEIIIDRPDVAPHKTAYNLAKARKVEDQLTSELGTPKTCDEHPAIAALDCLWVVGDAKAILGYRDIGGALPTLTVSYRKLKDVKPWEPRPVKHLRPR